MFESAPRDILAPIDIRKGKNTLDEADRQKRENAAVDFSKRVEYHAMKYGVYSAHRLFMIQKCCNYLQDFLKEKGKNTWPANCRKPVSEFQDVAQILIYAIADKGFLFDDEGFWRESPDTEPQYIGFDSPWKRSYKSYADFVYAIKRHHYTHMDLKLLRRNLDEHIHQDKMYMDDGVNALVEEQNTSEKIQNVPEKQNTPDKEQTTQQEGQNAQEKEENTPSEERNIDDYIRVQALRAYVNLCAERAKTTIESLTSEKGKIERFSKLLKEISLDRCLKRVAPLIIFGVLSNKMEPDISSVKAFLKSNSSSFNPKDRDRYCRLFQIITEIFPALETELFGQKYAVFDPIVLITGLQIRDGLQIADKELILLAHLCEDCIKEPQKKKRLKEYTQPVNGVAVGRVMEAFLILFQAQGYIGDAKETSYRGKKPRGLKGAIETLHRARIVAEDREDDTAETTEGNEENSCDEVAESIEIIKRKYLIAQYDYNWEVFWMISGYTPPPLFDWEKFNQIRDDIYNDPFDLYSIFSESIKAISTSFFDCFVQSWDDVSVPQAVRYDASNVRTVFAQYLYRNKNGEAQDFFHDLQEKVIINKLEYHSYEVQRRKLSELCMQKYMKIAPDNKKKLKSFEQYEDILMAAMADEVVKQLCAKIYNDAFQMLNLCNKYFWSVT